MNQLLYAYPSLRGTLRIWEVCCSLHEETTEQRIEESEKHLRETHDLSYIFCFILCTSELLPLLYPDLLDRHLCGVLAVLHNSCILPGDYREVLVPPKHPLTVLMHLHSPHVEWLHKYVTVSSNDFILKDIVCGLWNGIWLTSVKQRQASSSPRTAESVPSFQTGPQRGSPCPMSSANSSLQQANNWSLICWSSS